MKFMRNYRAADEEDGGDPMGSVANLFDTAVVFISALLLALIAVFDANDLFSHDSDMTIVKKGADGEMVLIEKKGKTIQAVRMTPEEAAGKGVRLGVAYQLEDGSMIYVPEQ